MLQWEARLSGKPESGALRSPREKHQYGKILMFQLNTFCNQQKSVGSSETHALWILILNVRK